MLLCNITSLKIFKTCCVQMFVHRLNYKISKATKFYACMKFIDILCSVADSTLKVNSDNVIFSTC